MIRRPCSRPPALDHLIDVVVAPGPRLAATAGARFAVTCGGWERARERGRRPPERCAILNPMVQYVDKAFAALADPTRRAVLERLGGGTATISELAEPFGISLTGMKKHVLVLEDAGLVLTEKVGRARRCTLAPYAFEGITAWLQRLNRFAEVVERTKGER